MTMSFVTLQILSSYVMSVGGRLLLAAIVLGTAVWAVRAEQANTFIAVCFVCALVFAVAWCVDTYWPYQVANAAT